jgi:basic membrane protein A
MLKKLYLVLALVMVAAMLLPACAPAAPDCTSDTVFCVGLVTDVGKIALDIRFPYTTLFL